ncbi:major facilitator superfamily domain-containing protein [Microdochium trichocladiopsis]|uniref:Major facilitator superfamily domain-containing protein n=1 Tax=Microdochium trichocladiopsis TaxID=1682393 RepID=A0A9P8YH60_9PEZI|nr:major facilitator superfamily domain-containing protein [Microdochium trichocladiopsis]KAH7039908.1 major facilitator superfamily domain-containing protein [Microdochium trichocladiopsis]
MAIAKNDDVDFANGTTDDLKKAEQATGDNTDIIIDEAAEKALIRKLDRWIIPPVMLLYLFSFLDRVNIGNARIYHMESDLGLEGNQYQLAVSVLFVTYILSELPSNLVIKKFTPSRWLAFITVAWGLVATMTGLVQNFAGLVACRIILGALEGGLFPGLAIYLTMFYTKREYGLRIGYLFVSAAIAGSMGGLLAYAIGFMEGVAGMNGWRWIMIIEGIPTVFLGVAIWWWLADDPDSAHYLTPEERLLIEARMLRQIGRTKNGDLMHKADVYAGLKDIKIWLFCVGQFGGDIILYGYSTFLPTIIRGLGNWSNAQVQALTIPCYALGAVTYLVVAWLSDRTQKRAVFVITFGLVCTLGYAILVSPAPGNVKYFGCFLAAMGLYVVVGIPLAWLPSNNPRYGKRTVATGLQLTIGNSAGVPAPFLYQTIDAPQFIKGHAVSMAFVATSTLIYIAFWLYFKRQNAQRDAGKVDKRVLGLSEAEVEELGEYNPRFRYTY